MPENAPAIDAARSELRLLPADPPPAVDLVVEESRLPYDLSGPPPVPALVRVVERFGLPVRPIVGSRREESEGGDGQHPLLWGTTWLKAAREAGMDRIPVRAIELPDVSAAFLALVLNQPLAADVAAQADALQVLLEVGIPEQDLARLSGLGRARIRRLAELLELHPVLRQGLREGRIGSQAAMAAARLSPASQEELAAHFEQEGDLPSAVIRELGGGADGADGAADMVVPEDAARRARRQAEELLRTLQEALVPEEIRHRVAEIVEELGRVAG
jgi:ParB-like chromosome segregation protein Spo0J